MTFVGFLSVVHWMCLWFVKLNKTLQQMASVESLCPPVACSDCKTTESSFWHKSNTGALCTTCYCQRDGLSRPTRRHALSSANSSFASKVADEPFSSDNSVRCGSASITRKSSRLKPLTKNKLWQSVTKPSSTKGRSKRYIFKKNVIIVVIVFLQKEHNRK